MNGGFEGLRRFWLPALIGAVWLAVCYWLLVVYSRSEPETSADSGGTESAADAGPAAEPDRILARIVIRSGPDGPASAWTDLEITGSPRAVARICEQVAGHEQARHLPAPLVARLERPCSDDELPEPPAGEPGGWLLVDEQPIGELDLLLMDAGPERGAVPGDGQPNVVRRTSTTPYPDEAACRQALDRLAREESRAQAEADRHAATFLDEELELQRGRVKTACEAGAESDECRLATEVLDLILKRRAAPMGSPERAGPLATKPICRPRRD